MGIAVLLTNKYFLIISAFVICVGGAFFYGMHIQKNNNAQLSGQLTEKQKELEAANNKLGVSQSSLVSLSDVNKKLASENDDLKKQFQAFVSKNKLQVKSIDDSIVNVNQQTTGDKIVTVEKEVCMGNSNSTIVNRLVQSTPDPNAAISYEWHDDFHRFELKDPDIFKSGNEVFTAKQYFRIFGVILKQKNGTLETRRMVLQEVYPKNDPNSTINSDPNTVTDPNTKIEYEEVPGSKAELVDSQFEYTNDVSKSIFRPRVIILFDSNRNLGLGAELLSFYNVGINVHATLPADFQNLGTGSLRLGAAYNFSFKKFQTNIGLGASVGTNYDRFFHSVNGTVDLIFYIAEF